MDITVPRNSPTGQALTADAEAAVSEALRDLAFWLYRQLENEYDWLTSDAAVDEAIHINAYTFTEAGLCTPADLSSLNYHSPIFCEDFIVSDTRSMKQIIPTTITTAPGGDYPAP